MIVARNNMCPFCRGECIPGLGNTAYQASVSTDPVADRVREQRRQNQIRRQRRLAEIEEEAAEEEEERRQIDIAMRENRLLRRRQQRQQMQSPVNTPLHSNRRCPPPTPAVVRPQAERVTVIDGAVDLTDIVYLPPITIDVSDLSRSQFMEKAVSVFIAHVTRNSVVRGRGWDGSREIECEIGHVLRDRERDRARDRAGWARAHKK